MKRLRKRKPPALLGNQQENTFFPSVQKKLAIGKADDPFEKEADAVADKVVNKSAPEGAIQKMDKPVAEDVQRVQKLEADEEPVQKMEEEEEASTLR